VKRKSTRSFKDEPLPGMLGYLADVIAETLILHAHPCVAREAAEGILEGWGYSEAGFMVAWAAGDFDA